MLTGCPPNRSYLAFALQDYWNYWDELIVSGGLKCDIEPKKVWFDPE